MEKISYSDEGQFCSGHVACAGCVEALSMRVILNAVGPDTVGVVAPSCSAVILGGHPMSAAKIPVLHGTLESAAASASGIKRALLAQGRDDTTVLCLAGDGGTYDIGLQALSSAAERNEDILYICFDNEGYMNTGGQKSSSTPLNAATGSTPLGKVTRKKNLIEILAAHRIPYIATTSPSHLSDMAAKIEKAKAIRGTKVIIVLIPCLPGWGVADNAAVKTARLGVESGVFPLFEIEDGVRYTMTVDQKNQPIDAYLAEQKRYRHLSDDARNKLQAEVDETWARLTAMVDNCPL
ncbi:MAG: pyruvate ferredoxin oxidoreductase [Roseibium sp.]|uniref:thiamine pyrophosphate-dependent enzyme n=1 Tax=Roseibium sp. TaxID=1936156 RepID=UPI0026368524|nr:thiamine pyrophosphate-dependent enzyme [Roseibium sp.]MCV0427987.1 pyruvate ferredoxin oxidoreductase [Roseibium sp.]